MAKHKIPKTREEFELALMHAFIAGCAHGYGIEHTVNVQEQEQLGAEHWIGRISDEDFYNRWKNLKLGE